MQTIQTLQHYIWLIPLFPLLGALFNGLSNFAGFRFSKKIAGGLAALMMISAFAVSVCVVWTLAHVDPAQRVFVNNLYPWIKIGQLQVDLAFLVDPLSAVMILIITGIGTLIHFYAIGYMWEDKSFQRFFTYLNFFVFFMLLLVLGENVLLMFVGWEGVGLCSYLLIGFWFSELPNAKAGMKAFVVNRIGDFAFIIGFSLLYWALTQHGVFTLSFRGIQENAHHLIGMMTPMGISVVTVVTLLFFIGATGKSAQIPLYVWLPDAMAGPTPVSALIHAATMVTAGIYMIGRTNVLFTMSPTTMTVVATVGVLTAFFAGTIGLVQNDIKKVLAYSTVSQLGYMFLGMGVGAFSAGVMHLMTHAFFKGLLFLGAGSVIHAMHHEQDMRKMGGLRKKIPYTYMTFLAGYLAIIGFPFSSGFISKDEILWKAFSSGAYGKVLWFLGLCGAAVTAFYMSRLFFMTFFGHFRGGHADHHGDHHHGSEHHHHEPHESPWIMVVPLMVLGLLSLFGGLIGLPPALGGANHFEHWLAPVFEHGGHEMVEHVVEAHAHHDPMEYILMVLSTGLAGFMVYLAYSFYGKESSKPKMWAEKFPALYRRLYNKYFVDEFYQDTVVKPTLLWSAFLARFDSGVVDGFVNLVGRVGILFSYLNGAIDRVLVDGMVNGVGTVLRTAGMQLRRVQTGRIQNYVYVLVVGVMMVIIGRILI